MSAIVLGVDPGVGGALAAVTLAGEYVGVVDLPVCRDGSIAWIDGPDLLVQLRELRGDARVVRAFVERVHAMPRNGSVAAFSQGGTLCSLLAALQIAGLPLTLLTPHAWKRAMGLVHERDDSDRVRKARASDRARLLFPDAPLGRVRDHGRAEALLIAEYGRQQLARAAA